jgi:hypothetical protein
LPALLEVCPKKCGYTSSCNDKEREWLLKNQHEITRAEALAAEITSHTQRKTDRVKAKASHHELSGSARAGRRVAIQQLGAELTHAAIGTCVPTSCAPRCCVYFPSGVPGRATARGGASGVLLLPLLRLLPIAGRVRWHADGPQQRLQKALLTEPLDVILECLCLVSEAAVSCWHCPRCLAHLACIHNIG